ncbi:hypothetical protein SAY87_023577 [Trapa incisa]|uniref:Scarecrow-like protein 1 n=1 Tax=Trapa incisa TaxID=236973 RepID=A0AAN7KYU5_9MYRT|nr:hypothetical protein SAY87_023577 [Trapa incisa]
MSLIRPNHYSLKGGAENPSNNHKLMYVSESSYSSESYDPKYFIESPIEEIAHPTGSGISGDLYHPSENLFVACPSNSESEYLENLSMDGVDYDEDKMRLKLQELERALLSDNEDGEGEGGILCGSELIMEVDGEWAVQNCPTNMNDSPKESCSSESYVSSISSNNKEISQLASRGPKQILIDCAAALSEENIVAATAMIEEVRRIVSIQGDPPQRIAAYMVEGLAARIAASGKYIYKTLKCKEPPSFDRLAAMQILFEICPCFKFGFMAANGTIIEAFKDEKRVHIIDFDINQGNQYITLIQTIASIPQKGNKPKPVLRLTGVDDPESVQQPVGGLKNIGQRLEKLAEALGVPFEFCAVPSRTSLVTPSMLCLKQGEAIIVNFAFQLHHMPDESVSITNERDQLLRMVKGLNPKLVTVVEQDVNTNTAPFFPRFIEAYNYYSAVFDSLDATLPRESQDRMNVERQCLARDIVNIVACEGEERIERYEVAGKWRARMAMAGFTSKPMSRHVNDNIREIIRGQYCNRYKVKEEMGALHFGWKDKSLIVTSVWR